MNVSNVIVSWALLMAPSIAGKIASPFSNSVTVFPGKPEPLPARAGDARNRASAQWSPAFKLPGLEKARLPATLVVGSNVAARGRGVEVWEAGGAKEHTVEEVLDHGTDFDRVSYF